MDVRFSDVVRFCGIIALVFALTALPSLPFQAAPAAIVDVMVLFAFLSGFFINRALERKHVISRAVSVELSRLRRIHHLSEVVSDQKWAGRVRASVGAYHESLGKNFLAHKTTSERFRGISHLIYGYKPKTEKDRVLFADLLATVKDVALERQQLEQALSGGMSWYSWAVMTTNAFCAVVLLLLNRFESQFSPLASAFVIAGILLALDLLARTNSLSSWEIAAYQRQYQRNVVGH